MFVLRSGKEKAIPDKVVIKRPARANKSAVRRKIHFPRDLDVIDDNYQSPHVDLAKTNCSTPGDLRSNTETVDNSHDSMDNVMDFVKSKLNEVMDAQESQMRKDMKENSAFRKKLLEVLRNGENHESLKKVKKAIQANRVEQKPLMLKRKDLMTIKPTEEGPSVFGRNLAAEFFGAEKACKLKKEQMGGKVNRRNTKIACEEELEEIFQLCVWRNYSNDAEEAVSRPIIGTTLYGAEMKSKYCL